MLVVLAPVLVACGGGSGSTSDASSGDVEVSASSSSAGPTTVVPVPTTSTLPLLGTTLVDFTEPGSVAGWSNVDDTVMGGVSASSATWEDGALVFSGTVSLENNGGFTSVVSPTLPTLADGLEGASASGAGAVIIEGAGDGRTYVLQLRSGAGDRRLWTQSFTLPVAGGAVELPLAGFTATDFRLDPVAPAPLDVAAVDTVAIYLVDGQAGPFRLAVTRLAAS